jgi:hypothetical protein
MSLPHSSFFFFLLLRLCLALESSSKCGSCRSSTGDGAEHDSDPPRRHGAWLAGGEAELHPPAAQAPPSDTPLRLPESRDLTCRGVWTNLAWTNLDFSATTQKMKMKRVPISISDEVGFHSDFNFWVCFATKWRWGWSDSGFVFPQDENEDEVSLGLFCHNLEHLEDIFICYNICRKNEVYIFRIMMRLQKNIYLLIMMRL